MQPIPGGHLRRNARDAEDHTLKPKYGSCGAVSDEIVNAKDVHLGTAGWARYVSNALPVLVESSSDFSLQVSSV